ncbi:MAG: hypothetical protein QNJ65_21660 [Xenococcaceae cyanobacterium MO_234.B1]|nr:hypothetical protein [Xenococcaceae cyanobacterium MO_234.B1]
MLTQFRHHYPQGSLISELINIDRGLYLVRVSIEANGVTLATGLAGADTIELAEDRARERAIAALGLEKLPLHHNQSDKETRRLGDDEERNKTSHTVQSSSVTQPTPEIKAPQPIPSPVESENHQPDFTNTSSTEVLTKEVLTKEVLTESNGEKPALESQEYPRNIFDQPIVESSASPESPSDSEAESSPPVQIDFNEIRHKIDLEMKRLNWTKEQGRDYLLSTYGKRSRLHLLDDELFEFLHYLETLPNS